MGKRWTEEELQFVKNNYLSMNYTDIGKNINRSESGVQHAVRKLGLITPFHNSSKTKLYTTWNCMHIRCRPYNKDSKAFKHYYSKGIRVCEEWDNFVKFKEWAENNGYKEGLTIERKDNNKGYEPNNCTWTPMSEQSGNRSFNVRITAFNETKTIAEWSKDQRCVVTYTTLWHRLKGGWDTETAISKLPILVSKCKLLDTSAIAANNY